MAITKLRLFRPLAAVPQKAKKFINEARKAKNWIQYREMPHV
ncbi:hypothetical protein [uncultured Selenomonas sp.]|nr:hypothetical protein [uncultured Selenomonas sp.]